MVRRGPASDPVASATSWAAARGIEIRRWDGDPVRAGGPVLYLVEPGEPPPDATPSQDWVRLPLDIDEVPARCARLLAGVGAGVGPQVPARLHIDRDGILHLGDEIRALTPMDVRVLELLLARPGAVVPLRSVASAAWPDVAASERPAPHGPIKRLRERLEGLPLEVHAVWRRGVRLVGPAAPPVERVR